MIRLSRWCRKNGAATLRQLMKALGYDVVRRSPYSPVPEVPPSDDWRWRREASLAGVTCDIESQFDLLRQRLAPFLEEFVALLAAPPDGWRFDPTNKYFQGADAAVLFALLRWLRPQRVIEIGAGASTVVATTASAMNTQEGAPCHVLTIDPSPRLASLERLSGLAELRKCCATEVALPEFDALASGDALVVDSSHTVKRGSEVNYIVLEVMPRLQPGVWVHFHDVFLPGDYPREWFERGTYLTEQYLLHAFLVDNPKWSIELALQALWRADPGRFSSLITVSESHPFGRSSLWLRRQA